MLIKKNCKIFTKNVCYLLYEQNEYVSVKSETSSGVKTVWIEYIGYLV